MLDISLKKLYGSYVQQKGNTEKPGKQKRDRNGDIVRFRLTFYEWLQIWIESGHLAKRGKHKGEYCMSRRNDIGDYSIGNVYIQLTTQNAREGQLGRISPKRGSTVSDEVRAKISEACKGRPSPNKGKALSLEHRAAISKAMQGKRNAAGH